MSDAFVTNIRSIARRERGNGNYELSLVLDAAADEFDTASEDSELLRSENARLRASEKALLQALRNVTERLENSWERRDLALDSDLEAVDAARAAIAQATERG